MRMKTRNTLLAEQETRAEEKSIARLDGQMDTTREIRIV